MGPCCLLEDRPVNGEESNLLASDCPPDRHFQGRHLLDSLVLWLFYFDRIRFDSTRILRTSSLFESAQTLQIRREAGYLPGYSSSRLSRCTIVICSYVIGISSAVFPSPAMDQTLKKPHISSGPMMETSSPEMPVIIPVSLRYLKTRMRRRGRVVSLISSSV